MFDRIADFIERYEMFPPGVRVVEATGNPINDALAVMPGAAGSVVRTAADVVRRTSDAVSATRSFLDDLRGRSRS